MDYEGEFLSKKKRKTVEPPQGDEAASLETSVAEILSSRMLTKNSTSQDPLLGANNSKHVTRSPSSGVKIRSSSSLESITNTATSPSSGGIKMNTGTSLFSGVSNISSMPSPRMLASTTTTTTTGLASKLASQPLPDSSALLKQNHGISATSTSLVQPSTSTVSSSMVTTTTTLSKDDGTLKQAMADKGSDDSVDDDGKSLLTNRNNGKQWMLDDEALLVYYKEVEGIPSREIAIKLDRPKAEIIRYCHLHHPICKRRFDMKKTKDLVHTVKPFRTPLEMMPREFKKISHEKAWKSLSKEEQSLYINMALTDKERFYSEMAELGVTKVQLEDVRRSQASLSKDFTYKGKQVFYDAHEGFKTIRKRRPDETILEYAREVVWPVELDVRAREAELAELPTWLCLPVDAFDITRRCKRTAPDYVDGLRSCDF